MKNIYVSQYANKELIEYLSYHDRTLHFVSPGGRTYPAVDSHPDMYYCKMGITNSACIFRGDPQEIGAAYPKNIPFNAVCLDGYFIHNVKYTSPSLLNKAREMGLKFINVNQGYTKCNCVIVDGHSIITSDEGTYNQIKKYADVEPLKIRTGYVQLTGFEYGFLGGASGRVGNEIVFNGDLSAHPDYEAIGQFIETRGLSIKYFPDYPLTDIGSILADF